MECKLPYALFSGLEKGQCHITGSDGLNYAWINWSHYARAEIFETASDACR